MSTQSLTKALSNRHLKYTLLLLLLVVGVMALPTVTLPYQVQPWVQELYDLIETLGPTDNVLYGAGPDGPVYWDVYPSALAVCKHLVQRKVNIIFYATSTTGVISQQAMIRDTYGMTAYQNHPDYGIKFIDLGYLAGGTATLQSMLRDFKGFLKVDLFGNSLTNYDKLPMMTNIKNGYDIKLDMGARSGIGYQYFKIVYGDPKVNDPWRGNPYGDKYTAWCGATQDRAQNIANWKIGQRDGYLGSTVDGAQYELLRNQPAQSMKFAVSATIGVLYIIGGIVVVNIQHVVLPRMRKKEA